MTFLLRALFGKSQQTQSSCLQGKRLNSWGEWGGNLQSGEATWELGRKPCWRQNPQDPEAMVSDTPASKIFENPPTNILCAILPHKKQRHI